MLVVVVLCSLLDGSCLEHQIPLNDEIRTPEACAAVAQTVLVKHMVRYPNHRVRRTACVDPAHKDRAI